MDRIEIDLTMDQAESIFLSGSDQHRGMFHLTLLYSHRNEFW